MTGFYALADQLHNELEELFRRWPHIDPNRDPADCSDALKKFGQKASWHKVLLGRRFSPVLDETMRDLNIALARCHFARGLHWNYMIPKSMARFIAWHWPLRWLPNDR